jgi:mono/diheme cytochrome c family protein
VIRALVIGACVSLVVVVIAVAQPFEPSKPKVAAAAALTGDAAHGATLYAASCAGCHGATGGGGAGPDITHVTAGVVLTQIASGGGTMPAGLVKGQDAADVAAFVDGFDGSTAAGAATIATTAATAPATTAEPATTTAPAPSEASKQALAAVAADLRKGQSQIDVLVQHTGFLEQALAQDNVFNVRFHAEHLANITTGEPIRDLDGNGQASNPGDGVGLMGEGGYVAEATAPFVTIAGDPGVAPDDVARATRAQASVAFMLSRLTTVVRQAEAAAKVQRAGDAAAQVRRIRAAVDDVQTSYAALRKSLPDYALAGSP